MQAFKLEDNETKEFWVNQGIKVGLTIMGVLAIKSTINAIVGEGGRTDRVKYNYDNTQIRQMPLGNGQFEIIEDPWHPADIARRLHTSMAGVQLTDSERLELWEEVKKLGRDRARWLHNYWLNHIDENDTLFRWINGEMMDFYNTDEQNEVLSYLINWGVGF